MPHRRLSPSDWWEQSQRDLRAAEHLLQGGFGPQAVAFAHLAVEKALKAVVRASTGETPPVTHNLIELARRTGAEWPAEVVDTLDNLSGLDVSLLYEPDALFRRRLPERQGDARQAVADARAIVDWIQHNVLPASVDGDGSSTEH
ncbi:HEPN domain-containing protein [Longibacter sp.]|uniref:HEPN domain-containing protein n=1 Tax=Longibacter sp. TaxID=2045415 RepID=UPI003EBF7245